MLLNHFTVSWVNSSTVNVGKPLVYSISAAIRLKSVVTSLCGAYN